MEKTEKSRADLLCIARENLNVSIKYIYIIHPFMGIQMSAGKTFHSFFFLKKPKARCKMALMCILFIGVPGYLWDLHGVYTYRVWGGGKYRM